MINSGKYLDEIISLISILRQEINTRAKLGLTDLNKHCEQFMKRLLNLTYSIELEDLNQGVKNFPGLDLGDKKQKIAYQITGTSTSEKVNETLRQSLDKKLYDTFTSINVFILTKKQSSYSLFETQPHFTFDAKLNIIDFDDLAHKIMDVDLEKRKEIYDFINKEMPAAISLMQGENSDSIKVISNKNEAQEATKNLIHIQESSKASKMPTFVHWKVDMHLPQHYNWTAVQLDKLFSKHLLSQKGIILPPILTPSFRQPRSGNSLKYIAPLHSTGPANHLIEEQLEIKGGLLTYEFCEYHDNEFSLARLDFPVSSIVCLLLTLDRVHEARELQPIYEVDLSVQYNKPVFFHSNHSPFDVGFKMAKYQLPVDRININEILYSASNDSIYSLCEKLYDEFHTSKSSSSAEPYLSIDRHNFNKKMLELRGSLIKHKSA